MNNSILNWAKKVAAKFATHKQPAYRLPTRLYPDRFMQLLFLAAMLAADDSLAGSSPSLSSPTATSYSVALKWKDPSSSEQKWTVERSTSSGGSFTVIATLSSNRTSYVDSRVVPNKTYYYRVSYLTSGGSTKYSDTEKVKTKSDTTVPVATSPASVPKCKARGPAGDRLTSRARRYRWPL